MQFCRAPGQPTAPVGEINHPPFDPMTLVHGGIGLALGLFRLGLLPTLVVAVGWEVAEHVLKDCLPHAFVFPSQDTLANAAGDVMATLVGWRLSRYVQP